jgi:hypothetical protein
MNFKFRLSFDLTVLHSILNSVQVPPLRVVFPHFQDLFHFLSSWILLGLAEYKHHPSPQVNILITLPREEVFPLRLKIVSFTL